MSLSDVSLVVLAGGRGQRMGGMIKPLLRHGSSETLVSRIVSTLRTGGQAVYIVAPAVLHPPLAAALADAADARPRLLTDPGEGPARALAAAAAVVSSDWMAAVAGDLVAPDLGLLGYLAEHRRAAVDGVLPVVDGFDQSLFALYRTTALREPEPPFAVRRWLARLKVLRVPVTDPVFRRALVDVDTVEQARAEGLASPADHGFDDPSDP